MFWFLPKVSAWGEGAFLPANDSAQVRLRAQQSTVTGQRLEKVPNVDVAQKKGNVALVRQNGKRIKRVTERELTMQELGCFVMDRKVLNIGG